MVLRSSGEQRLSNYMIWQAAYAEFVALETLWPDFDRRHLWYACELFAQRDRRFGGALPNPVAPPEPVIAVAGSSRSRG
jgi:undecaprenyl diphosphate synthase